MLPAQGVQLAGYKRSDLSLADRLFIAAVTNLPPERRPWGSITWLADVFNTSRPTVYAIGERGRTGMQALPMSPRLCACLASQSGARYEVSGSTGDA